MFFIDLSMGFVVGVRVVVKLLLLMWCVFLIFMFYVLIKDDACETLNLNVGTPA